MGDLAFGIRIGARDDTQSTLSGVMSEFRSFARTVSKPITIPLKVAGGGLRLLRDINLGLAPVVRGIDRLIERGTGLEVVRKSFASLTGTSAKQAESLARHLVDASGGALRTAKAMQLANRAIASGIKVVRDLPTIMEFAAKKAATTGMEIEFAMDRIITGLSRGSAAILDDFGLLNDGLEGVKLSYDAIAGSGAFESLGPAAQKAELVRQAMGDIRRQLGRMGVSGMESVFVFQAIKTQIGDATDKLFAMVGRSGQLKSALQGVRDMISGVTEHLKKGGSIWNVLLGKEGGKSGGVFGLLKAAMLDLGGFSSAWETIKPKILSLTDEVGARLGQAVQPLADALAGFSGAIGPLASLLAIKPGSGPTTQPATTQPVIVKSASSGMLRAGIKGGMEAAPGVIASDIALGLGVGGLSRVAGAVTKQAAREQAARQAAIRVAPLAGNVAAAGSAGAGLLPTAAGGTLRFIAQRAGPIAIIASFLYEAVRFGRAIHGLAEAREDVEDAQNLLNRTRRTQQERRGASGFGGPTPLGLPASLLLGSAVLGGTDSKMAADQRGGGKGPLSVLGVKARGFGVSRVRQWSKNFREDYPPGDAEPFVPSIDPSKFALTGYAKRRLGRQIRSIKREFDLIGQGNRGVRQEALWRTGQEVNRLRGEGYRISPRERRQIFEELQRQLIKSHTQPLGERAGRLLDELDAARERDRQDLQATRIRRRDRRALSDTSRADGRESDRDRALIQAAKDISGSSRQTGDAVERFEQIARELSGIFAEVMVELGGAERRLARIG